MSTFSEQIQIDAPKQEVWDVLADIGSIHVWHPGVKDSRVTTEGEVGLGSERRCDLGGRTYLQESVVAWSPLQNMTIRILDTNTPFRTADIHFELHEEGGATTVRVSPQYELKYGPVGKLMDVLMVRTMYRKGMRDLLAGLKRHVEAGLGVGVGSTLKK